MCGIAGIKGENISNYLKEMLVLLKHRGPDDSGIWVNNHLIQGEISKIDLPEGKFGLGHNLLSIVGCHGFQPIVKDNEVLICNGEIYNYLEIKEFLDKKKDNYASNDFKTDSDCEIIINLNRYYKKNFEEKSPNGQELNSENLLIESLKKTLRMLDGDYAFALWDGENLALARDPVGVKPLYYGENGKLSAFASERKALWKIGIREVNSLPPGHMLFNGKLILVETLFDEDKIRSNEYFNKLNSSNNLDYSNKAHNKAPDKVSSNNMDYSNSINSTENISLDLKETLNYYKNKLRNDLVNSVQKRIHGLEKVGLIFSGGVDSTLIAAILNKSEIETTLYTVGTFNSSDLQFALKAAEYYDLQLKTMELSEKVVKDSLKPVLEAIEEFNVMKIGVAMPIYLASKMASEDKLKVVLSGQGADELFGGYHRYLNDYANHGDNTQNILKEDIKNIYHVNLQRDDSATMAHGVELRVPFLDKEVIKTAFKIPMQLKIENKNDTLRKHILRQVAQDVGVPEFIAQRPKKAAQYGSGVHKILIKKVLKDFDDITFMKQLKGF